MADFNKLIQEKYISSGKAYGGDINKDNTKAANYTDDSRPLFNNGLFVDDL